MTKIFTALCLTILLMIQSPAWACKPPPPNLTFEQVLMREPVVFIGKILSVDNGEVSVFVEHPFKGVMAGGYVTELPPTTSCRVFTPQVGERWFFSGMFEPSPTMLLQKAETEGEPQQVEGQPTPTANLVRLDDIKLNMPAEYQECETSIECMPIPYDCTQTSVNRLRYNDAQQTILQRGKRPKMRGCHTQA
ncbi:MAG TPA: hypothetical protein PKH37_08080, partial [Alphaproteobacteria bacterium]|nr:hypothetical protein [Alphaproteobacteria bacterium]